MITVLYIVFIDKDNSALIDGQVCILENLIYSEK